MPNPKLETYKNKATNIVYDLTDAAAQTALSGILDGTNIDSFGDVETALAGKSDISIVAPAFSTLTAYTIGQYVTYEGKLYRFKNNHSAGAWNSDQVYEVTVGHDLEHKQDTTGFSGEDFIITTHGHTGQDYETMSVALNKADAPTLNDTKPITSGAVYNYAFPRSEQAVLGAVNIAESHLNASSDGGVSYVRNADETITCSNQATANGGLKITNNFTLKAGKSYKIVGCPASGSDTTYKLILRKSDNTSLGEDKGNGLVYTPSTDTECYLQVRYQSGYTANETFKPMVTLNLNATYADYVPYAMTNKELTDAVTPTAVTTDTVNGLVLSYSIVGKLCVFTVTGTPADASINTEYTVPKALIGVYLYTQQWADPSKTNRLQLVANATTMTVSEYSANGIRLSGSYVIA